MKFDRCARPRVAALSIGRLEGRRCRDGPYGCRNLFWYSGEELLTAKMGARKEPMATAGCLVGRGQLCRKGLGAVARQRIHSHEDVRLHICWPICDEAAMNCRRTRTGSSVRLRSDVGQ